MEWRDEGLLIGAARHGERDLILDVLTASRGRWRGLARRAASAKRAAEFQLGAQLSLRWRARLESQLGVFEAEALRARAGLVLDDPLALAGLSAACAWLEALIPEREPQPRLYAETVRLFDAIASRESWREAYARWELGLLEELGFGLDLTACAATGTTQSLIYVSPRSGRAVSREAGAPYADRLLPLPGFLQLEGAPAAATEFAEALRLTAFFLERWAGAELGLAAAPAARARLGRLAMAAAAPEG